MVLVYVTVISAASLIVGIVLAPAELLVARLVTLALVVGMVSLLAVLVRRSLRPRPFTPYSHDVQAAPVSTDGEVTSGRPWLLIGYYIGMLSTGLLAAYLDFFTDNELPWSLAGSLSWTLVGVGFVLPSRMPGTLRR
jgi:hypothetical protein